MKDDALIVGGIALAILGVLWYAKGALGNVVSGAAQTVKDAASAAGSAVVAAVPYVNPADNKNLIYQGANGVTNAITGNQDASVGTTLYDLINN